MAHWATLQWNGKEDSDDVNPDSRSGKGIFKVVPLLKDDVLMKLTRMLVGGQKEALSKIVSICKGIVKERSTPLPLNKQLLFLIHGGAGKCLIFFCLFLKKNLHFHDNDIPISGTGKSKTIEAMSCWAEKILTKAGDHPLKPRVLIVAATGKAAANVGK